MKTNKMKAFNPTKDLKYHNKKYYDLSSLIFNNYMIKYNYSYDITNYELYKLFLKFGLNNNIYIKNEEISNQLLKDIVDDKISNYRVKIESKRIDLLIKMQHLSDEYKKKSSDLYFIALESESMIDEYRSINKQYITLQNDKISYRNPTAYVDVMIIKDIDPITNEYILKQKELL